MTDLTGANSSVSMIFPFSTTPIELQDFSIEEAVVTSVGDLSQTNFDLQGKPHYALVFNEYTIDINFLASSPSIDFFIRWKNAMYLQKMALGSGILSVTIFPRGQRYTFYDCVLKRCGDMPALQNVLGNVSVTLACNPRCSIINL